MRGGKKTHFIPMHFLKKEKKKCVSTIMKMKWLEWKAHWVKTFN